MADNSVSVSQSHDAMELLRFRRHGVSANVVYIGTAQCSHRLLIAVQTITPQRIACEVWQTMGIVTLTGPGDTPAVGREWWHEADPSAAVDIGQNAPLQRPAVERRPWRHPGPAAGDREVGFLKAYLQTLKPPKLWEQTIAAGP
jgi:hypothetical protein